MGLGKVSGGCGGPGSEGVMKEAREDPDLRESGAMGDNNALGSTS